MDNKLEAQHKQLKNIARHFLELYLNECDKTDIVIRKLDAIIGDKADLDVERFKKEELAHREFVIKASNFLRSV